MKKGIMFSTDAILALAMVIIFIAWAPSQINAMEEQGKALENMQDQAMDKAIIGHYQGTPGTALIGNEQVYKCVATYEINPNNDLGTMATPNKKNFCEAR